MRRVLLVILTLSAHGCAGADTDDGAPAADASMAQGVMGDDAAGDAAVAPPTLELTPDLCEDASHMDVLLDSFAGSDGDPSYGAVNSEQILRMLEAPTEGPFYMVNLIRYRDQARYPDGRETDLTGREANALYAPIDFLAAIGAEVVFVAEVDGTTMGEAGTWDEVAIVEYPCPLALFAMSADPAFQARAVHKEAGVEATIVMVTHLQPLDEAEAPETPYPATADDPAFDLVRVHHLREQAQYADGASEPDRTGQEAMDLYVDSVADAERQVGVYPKARFTVQGVFIGDERAWDQVWIDFVPSHAALEALAEDPAVVAAQPHLEAALEDAYGLVTHPLLASLPGAPGGDGVTLPPVTADGTGTLCQTDDDCPGDGVDTCFMATEAGGFCSREGCGAGDCQSPYVCCRDCSPVVAAMLPFEGSICLPDFAKDQLTAAPASCTCD